MICVYTESHDASQYKITSVQYKLLSTITIIEQLNNTRITQYNYNYTVQLHSTRALKLASLPSGAIDMV